MKIDKDIAQIKLTFFISEKPPKLQPRFYEVVQLQKNVLGGLVMCHLFANFLYVMLAKNNEIWLTCVTIMSSDKVSPFWDTV